MGAIGAIGAGGAKGAIAPAPAAKPAAPLTPAAKPSIAPAAKTAAAPAPAAKAPIAPTRSQVAPAAKEPIGPTATGAIAPDIKDRLLSEIRAGKPFFYNTVIAQAQRIDVAGDRVTFVFSPTHRALREQFEQSRGWVETTAERVVGRRILVESAQGATASPAGETAPAQESGGAADKRDLKADAMSSSAIQAVLDVFPAEIRDVEEMEP
jgi:hypothetical protein